MIQNVLYRTNKIHYVNFIPTASTVLSLIDFYWEWETFGEKGFTAGRERKADVPITLSG